MDLPRRLGLAVLAGLDAEGLAAVRASIGSLASHPTPGPPLDFLAALDDELGLVQAVLTDTGGPELVALACYICGTTGLELSSSLTAAAGILRPART